MSMIPNCKRVDVMSLCGLYGIEMRSILLPIILFITVLRSWASCFSPALRLSSSRVGFYVIFSSATTATHQDEEKLKVQQLYQCQGMLLQYVLYATT